VKAERVELAIADDLAFLAAHPVRQSSRRLPAMSELTPQHVLEDCSAARRLRP